MNLTEVYAPGPSKYFTAVDHVYQREALSLFQLERIKLIMQIQCKYIWCTEIIKTELNINKKLYRQIKKNTKVHKNATKLKKI